MLKEKHIRETVRSFGLKLVQCLPTEGASYRIEVEAADGETQVMRINARDGNSDFTVAQNMRRFANAHGRIAPPGKPLPPTALETAMMAAQTTEPEPEPTMAQTLTLAPKTTAPEVIVKPRQRALTHVQFAKMAAVVATLDTQEYETKEALSAFLATKLGFDVSPRSVDDALDMHGKKTKAMAERAAPRGRVTQSNSATLARALVHLYEKLGEKVPDEVRGML